MQDRGTSPLKSDVRQSFKKVAKSLNIDVGTVRDRINKLQDSGFIKGWHVFPNPHLFNLGVAHARVEIPAQYTMKEDMLRKIRLMPGVWMIVNHYSNSIRVILYFEDEESLRKQIELIATISNSENILHREILFPLCAIALSHDDLAVIDCIQKDSTKSVRRDREGDRSVKQDCQKETRKDA